MDNYEAKIKALENTIETQSKNGTWNKSSYMYGLLNGLILAESIFKGTYAKFPEKPNIFFDELKILETLEENGTIVKTTKKVD